MCNKQREDILKWIPIFIYQGENILHILILGQCYNLGRIKEIENNDIIIEEKAIKGNGGKIE